MTNVVIIPADANQPIRAAEASTYEDYRDIVGGYIEFVSTMLSGVAMYDNEDGKAEQLPPNPRASKLARLFPGDLILGDVVLFGYDDSGEELDCPKTPEELASMTAGAENDFGFGKSTSA